MEKMTKKAMWNSILTIEEVAKNHDYVEFINKEIAALDKRTESAKARTAKRAAASDALTDEIYNTLSTDFMTVEQIVAAIDRPEVTSPKVVARLGKLFKDKKIEKTDIVETIGEAKRKIKAYRVAVVE